MKKLMFYVLVGLAPQITHGKNITSVLNQGDLVFDIGTFDEKKIEPYLACNARVVCFEPQSSSIIIVSKNLMNHEKTSLTGIANLDTLIHQYGTPKVCKIAVKDLAYQILCGLTKPITYLSFEFSKKIHENNKNCLNYLYQLGYRQFNLYVNEQQNFIFDHWVSKETIDTFIESSCNASLKGEIYAYYPLTYKRFSTSTTDALRIAAPYLPHNPIIVEAGACDGADSAFMACFWPAGTLHSFEPVPELYAKLKEKAQSFPNIHTYDLALSTTAGTATFYISEDKYNQGRPSASSSLLEPKDHLKYFPDVLFKKTIPVHTITLDQWAKENHITSIDFLWLDMQGSELNALMASPEILKTVKAILTEVEFVEEYKGQYLYGDVKSWLETQGFELMAVDFDPNYLPCSADALFVRSSEITHSN